MASKKMKDEVPPEGSQEEERIENLIGVDELQVVVNKWS